MINSKEKKYSLASGGPSEVSYEGEQQPTKNQFSQSRKKKHSRRFSQQKVVSDVSPAYRIGISPSQKINQDSMLENPANFPTNSGKMTSMSKDGQGDTDDDQTQHRSPRVINETMSQAEIPNLSTYQSQAVVP